MRKLNARGWMFWSIAVLLLMVVEGQAQTIIKLGFLGRNTIRWGPPVSFGNVGSAVKLAIDDINANSSILPNHQIEFEMADDQCTEKPALDIMVNLTKPADPADAIQAIIGPTCSGACRSLSLLASQWNVPVIGYLCANGDMSDKNRFDTFMRSVPPFDKVGSIVVDILGHFNWSRIGVLISSVQGYHEFILDGLVTAAETANVTIFGPETIPYLDAPNTPSVDKEFEDAVQAIIRYSRSKLMQCRM